MTAYRIEDLLEYRKELAMNACGIFDEEEVGRIEPISYIEYGAGRTFVTVWLFGNKKIYSAMIELLPGEWEDPTVPHGKAFFDVSR